MVRATKIVATLGPVQFPEVLERMLHARGRRGAPGTSRTARRRDHIDRATLVREVATRPARRSRSWPTCRARRSASASSTAAPRSCSRPAFILDAATSELGNHERVGLTTRDLPRDVKPGDTLLLNDGLIRLTVEAVRGEEVVTTVVIGGELSNNKGINKAGGGSPRRR